MPALQQRQTPPKSSLCESWIIASYLLFLSCTFSTTLTVSQSHILFQIRLTLVGNAIAQARLNGLEKELGMNPKSSQFNTTVSILFVGYVLMQVPSNMLITKVRPSMYMSGWMAVWAIVSACTALVQNYAGLVACRFLLGVTEAPVGYSSSLA